MKEMEYAALDAFLACSVVLNLLSGLLGACIHVQLSIKTNSVALVRKRTIPTERPPPVGEVSSNFYG